MYKIVKYVIESTTGSEKGKVYVSSTGKGSFNLGREPKMWNTRKGADKARQTIIKLVGIKDTSLTVVKLTEELSEEEVDNLLLDVIAG